jgi:F420-0:gamma-glutamyl ligase
MTKINVADAMAAAAVLCMGESNEQTPIAVIDDPPFVEFVQAPPTDEEISSMHIAVKDDLYGHLLTAVKWQKGGKAKE